MSERKAQKLHKPTSKYRHTAARETVYSTTTAGSLPATSNTVLRIQMLGRFAIFAGDMEISLPTAKVRSLAAYLFWQHGTWIRRSFLSSMLWEQADEQRAAANLRQVIYCLRHALESAGGSNILEVRRDTVRVSDAPGLYAIDVAIFWSKAWDGLRADVADTKSLVDAASTYQGDFLEDLSDEWCLTEGRRFAYTHLHVLKELANRLSGLRLFQAALIYAHRWVVLDPFNEEAHRTLMSLYAEMGEPYRAVQEFEHCRQVLRSELSTEPSEETIRLYEEIGRNKQAHVALQDGAHHRFHNPRSNAVRKLSHDPLRNARLLLIYGESSASYDIEESVKIFKKALSIYEKLDNKERWAEAMLVAGATLLHMPAGSRPNEALQYIEPALAYYRAEEPSTNLTRAMALASEAYWLCGRCVESVGLAKEGLELAGELSDKNSTANFALTLGLVCIAEYRIEEGQKYLETALRSITSFAPPEDMLRLVTYRGFVELIACNAAEAEGFLREALRMLKILPPSPKNKEIECLVRGYLVMCLCLEEKRDQIRQVDLTPELERHCPEHLAYMLSLLRRKDLDAGCLASAAKWVRVSLSRIPAIDAPTVIRQIVLQSFELGLIEEAGKWSVVGVRFTRAQGWMAYAAMFYGYRAVALAKQGQIVRASYCRSRAELSMDEGDAYTPAWVAWSCGLSEKVGRNEKAATRHFSSSLSQFSRLGCEHHVRLVKADMKG